jgi:hypothetical protein
MDADYIAEVVRGVSHSFIKSPNNDVGLDSTNFVLHVDLLEKSVNNAQREREFSFLMS